MSVRKRRETTMRGMLTALALLIAASGAAEAACKDEVAAALERQRKSSGFRMQTVMLSQDGLVNMTVDYVLPDRMHQTVSTLKDPTPVETILVGKQAWSRQNGPWTLLQPETTNQLVEQMKDTVGEDETKLTDFECLGKQSVAGKDLLAYQGENEDPEEKKDAAAKDKPKAPDRPVRIIYVDPTTGLPLRSVFGRANKLDKPIFEANYSYPVDIKVEQPKLDAK
jgi:hypothetical protein